MRKGMAALLVLSWASVATADEYHNNDVFMGARATGLGGTMIGLADEPSAAYYNPAGLAHAKHDMVSLSATAVVGRQLVLKNFLGSDLDLGSTNAFSPSGVTTSPLGKGRLAFSGLTPSAEAYRVNEVFTSTPQLNSLNLNEARIGRERSDNTYLVGLSYGQDVGRDFDLGVAAFYVFRSYREHRSDYREFVADEKVGVDASGADVNARAFQRSYDEQGISHGILVIAGLLYHPGGEDGRFRLGVTARMPVNVSTSAVVDQETFIGRFVAAGQPLTFDREPALNSSAIESRIPPMLGVGLSFKILPNWVVALDGTLHGYDSYTVLGQTVVKNTVINGSFGSEYQISKSWWVRLGAFTNRTSAPAELSTDATAQLQADSWDQYGGTAGMSYQDDHHHSYSLAVKYAVMMGHARVLETPVTASVLPEQGRELSVVFGGSYFF